MYNKKSTNSVKKFSLIKAVGRRSGVPGHLIVKIIVYFCSIYRLKTTVKSARGKNTNIIIK